MYSDVSSIFLSDIHLGSKHCKSKELLLFLQNFKSLENLFLIGDIIDTWKIAQHKIKWGPNEDKIIRRIFKFAKDGTNVVYILGNHEDYIHSICPLDLGNIHICREYIYESDKKYLLIHGDQFDKVVQYSRWLSFLGDKGYELLLNINKYLPTKRSLSSIIKYNVKKAVNFMSKYEEISELYCRERGCDAIITGHIHKPAFKERYYNCGDWVESCTAIIERNGLESVGF